MGFRGRAGFGQGPMVRGGRRSAVERLSPQTREALAAAHGAVTEGRWADAAEAFDKLGGVAQQRQLPRIAAFLYARAATAHGRAGAQPAMLASAEKGLQNAVAARDNGFSARVFGSFLAALKETDFADGEPAIREAMRNALGVAPREPGPRRAPSRDQLRNLPASCEVCGSPLNGDELQVSDEGRADCPTCGSAVL
ncbi:MAG: hypothetical protein H6735_04460 [Alphaproteobacteria bacterium]|nr:hypothetical protein [Alphaproteobacteria bacterium]